MVSFVIMLLIWVGNQALTIYLSFLIVLPLIYTNTLAGFLNVDPEMLEMAETFRLSRWKKFLYIYRPSFMPFLISSCRSALNRELSRMKEEGVIEMDGRAVRILKAGE